MPSIPKMKLNNGIFMPSLGLGTYKARGEELKKAVKHAIDVGYRHFDTAFLYKNEKELGEAINEKISEGVIKREDIFVSTKLWGVYHQPDLVVDACKKSLHNLDLGYIDLFLMHTPIGLSFRRENAPLPRLSSGLLETIDTDYLEVWHEMEKCVDQDLTKSIGVSNFNTEQMTRLLSNCIIPPANLQIETSIRYRPSKLIDLCKRNNVVVTAYSPLGCPHPNKGVPDFYEDKGLLEIAKKYKKTPAQIALRFCIDVGTVPLPKSVTPSRIEKNINVFDFQLTTDEIKYVETLHTGDKVAKFESMSHHKYFPFNIE